MKTKFTPIDLELFYNADRSPANWHPAFSTGLAYLPAGHQILQGVPFALGPAEGTCWLVFSQADSTVDIPLTGRAGYVMLAHFCFPPLKWDAGLPADNGLVFGLGLGLGFAAHPGEVMARYTLIYQDGSEIHTNIRRRFEIGDVVRVWGEESFACLRHAEARPVTFDEPNPPHKWGWYQQALKIERTPGDLQYWIYALPNPAPEKELTCLRIESTGMGGLAIAGLTLYHGKVNPLQRRPLETLRVSLPESADPGSMSLQNGANISLDMGVIARRNLEMPLNLQTWLDSPAVALGTVSEQPAKAEALLLDVSAHPEATLTVEAGGSAAAVDLKPVFEGVRAEAGSVVVVGLSQQKTWLPGKVIDTSTGQPTPCRLSFRTADGRYFPPYGHRHEVNTSFLEDQGGDLKLGESSYAYVDGRFQIELPVGDVFVEISKGFEYQPVRTRLTIEPGQRELDLEIQRTAHWRERGWVTADTHVHFISPQTAWLEARAEGVNLVNLLASQWGDLFTNVADLTGQVSGVSQDDTLVWVGTENRQHMLGHLSLLGSKGTPVFPMCAAGPDESYFGDPASVSLAEWSDRCREKEGLVVLPHFPMPYCESAADIVLDKVDAVELANFNPNVDSPNVREWYRFLNCGYRLAAVGGTDKMSACIPVGGVRTYALLEDGKEFSFEAWAQAVRSGRTFTTSGPLLRLSVEGRGPGEEIRLPDGGGTIEIEASVESVYPVHELEIVVSGQVVASERIEAGSHRTVLRERLKVRGSAWIAARCSSRLKGCYAGQSTHLAAHTSPVYLVGGEGELFSSTDATYMLTLIEGGLTWLDTLSIPPDPERAGSVRDVFQKAHDRLSHRLLHKHGRPG